MNDSESINRAVAGPVSEDDIMNLMRCMVHDLRMSVNAVMGYAGFLEGASDDPGKVCEYAGKISGTGRCMLELINGILDKSCVDTGRVIPSKADFSISSMVKELVCSIAPQMETGGVKFSSYITGDYESDIARGDKLFIRRILGNLLSNAEKYTPAGGSADLILEIRPEPEGNIRLVCTVKDTGVGMSREFSEDLFRPFAREENGLAAEGAGLGMAIVKSLVELMDGSIEVESRPGKGTDVTVELPLEPASGEPEIPPVKTNRGMLTGIRFLAAEDNDACAEIMHEVLLSLGAECVIACNGREAVELFEKSADGGFDMILMDINMPVMDGYQAVRAIRESSHSAAAEIPVLAMTAAAFDDDIQKAFASGMDGHVAKPLDIEIFIDTVKELLE